MLQGLCLVVPIGFREDFEAVCALSLRTWLCRNPRMEYQIVVFRRPMVFSGYYTISRRDVSQTPFVLMREITKQERHQGCSIDGVYDSESSTQKHWKRVNTMDVTSMEEQICGPIRGSPGFSTLNNSSGGGIVHGMIQFHALRRDNPNKQKHDHPRNVMHETYPMCHISRVHTVEPHSAFLLSLQHYSSQTKYNIQVYNL